MAKSFNPFEHHHHHHDDEPQLSYDQMDAAQRSLADALRVSFLILKIVMVILVALYLFSGTFYVPSGKVAVVMRFGQIVGESPEEQVFQPGKLNFAFPFPIDQIVEVPAENVRQELIIDKAFWYTRDDAAASQLTVDQGSLITGDANIVHAQFVVYYYVDDPVAFVRALVDPKLARDAERMAQAEEIVRAAATEGIVHAIATIDADSVVRQSLIGTSGEARKQAQNVLDRLDCGVRIGDIAVRQTAMPASVRDAYNRVSEANNEAQDEINKARRQANDILGSATGSDAHDPLWELIKQYELVADRADSPDPDEAAAAREELKQLDGEFERIFRERRVPVGDGNYVPIDGEAAAAITAAEAFVSEVTREADTKAKTFRSLLEKYREGPEVFMTRAWLNARDRIFSNWRRIDLRIVPPGINPWLVLPPNKALTDRIEREQLQQENQQRNQ